MNIDVFLKNLGISDHPGLRVDLRLEGYRDFTFGCRIITGEPEAEDLAHELAHAAQFGARHFRRRARVYGFNFRMRQVEVDGELYDEPITTQGTLRELQTSAYQAHLLEFAGVPVDHDSYFEAVARTLNFFMKDWYWVPGDSNEERMAWCVQQGKAFYAQTRPETVLRRLRKWLDKTEKHLALRGKTKRQRRKLCSR
jgi:hypothetical protein